MKKIFVILFILVSASCLLFSEITFSFFAKEPLYKPYYADSFNPITRFEYMKLIDSYGPYQILTSVEREDDVVYENDPTDLSKREAAIMEKIAFQDANSFDQFMRMKVGTSLGLLRFQADWFKVEFNLQGALNLVFNAKKGTDLLGFDGIYFLGFNFSLFDKIKLRIGKHHYSGHYGDEIMEDFLSTTDEKGRLIASRILFTDRTPGRIYRLADYVRQDSLILGLSVEPFDWLRLYFEADIIPKSMKNVRPWMLCPENRLALDPGAKEQGMSLDTWGKETEIRASGSRNAPYGNGYQDLLFNIGGQIRLSFGMNFGVDIRLMQEGQTLYQIGAYSKDNPWAIDYNIILGQEFGSENFKVEAIYHSGRFPLTNFFWHNCQYVSVGFSYLI